MSETKMRWPVLMASLTILLTVGLSTPADAAKGGNGGGNGGGGDKGGAKGGGDIVGTRITFVDEMGYDGNRISSDGLGAYVHGEEGVDAFIGSGGNEGDLSLWLADATRGLWLDFGACYPDPTACATPFPAGVDGASSITVVPSDVRDGGLYGIAAGETVVGVPMHMNYDFAGPNGPGFIYFDPEVKGRNPCKNKSMRVSITRPGEEQRWIVSADASVLACSTLPGGDYSGQYQMPFQFTVEVLP